MLWQFILIRELYEVMKKVNHNILSGIVIELEMIYVTLIKLDCWVAVLRSNLQAGMVKM